MEAQNKIYTCSICGRIFENECTEEESINELKNTFGDYSIEECDTLCDDCYNNLMQYFPLNQ